MLRLISRALVAFALLGGAALAQSFTLPELGLQNSGNCRQLAARHRTSNAMIALGCLDTVAKGWNLTPNAVGVTAPYAAAALNVQQNPFRVQIGDCDASWQFDAMPTLPGITNTATYAITGCVTIPAGTSNSQANWPDAGVAGIANTYNAGKSAIGLFGLSGAAVDGALAQAGNFVVSNTPTGAQSRDGYGRNAPINTIEADANVFRLPDGSAPTGTVTGVSSYIAGTVQPAGNSQAFQVISAGAIGPDGYPVPRWKFGFMSDSGHAQTGVFLGAQRTNPNGTPTISQLIQLNSFSGSAPGFPNGIVQVGQIYNDSNGSLRFNTNGLTASGGLLSSSFLMSPFGQFTAPGLITGLQPTQGWTIDNTAAGVPVPAGGTLSIVQGSGMILLRESITGNECMYFVGVGQTKLVSQLMTNCDTTPGSGKVAVSYANNAYTITNGLSGTSTINVTSIRNASSN